MKISRYSRNERFHRNGRWAIKSKPKIEKKEKEISHVRHARGLPSHKGTPKTATLRKGIAPGSVLVLLSGRHRGCRVVFLKQLASGLLLVTGPMHINGVPLRRVDQAYVIPTSTSIDISELKLEDKVNDELFKKVKPAKHEKSEEGFEKQGEKPKYVVSDERKALQKVVDAVVEKAVERVPYMKAYLGAHFTLSHGQRPHEMVL
uniref:60S ribosomal protein L6-1 n=1 Tax=Stygiella incarcerata TaxID=1712417 RepID=A0A192ZHM0_9EUKA|nr:60S ribosomal protein L6-1 [Stygiella incarcerata]|eukprot:TRINITY_DN1295_c0_g1_i1.p1 TRINITY_DN1295_c0_g1~~TRINITY_DN1295_c0_g1_i1.p1  ORF type:complete len:204 (+),score=50.96 TRINITY_DN1295_c0_g1_i1:120-731(+)